MSADQRRFFQKALQAVFAGMVFVELAGGGQQFLEVGQPLLIFFVVRFFEQVPIARLAEHVPQNFFDRTGGHEHQAVDHGHELGHGHGGPLGERLDQAALAGGIQQRQSLCRAA